MLRIQSTLFSRIFQTTNGFFCYSTHTEKPIPIPVESKLTRNGDGKEFRYLTDAQLIAELDRCLHCATKPCQKGCPVNCSPADFIYAAKDGMKSGGTQRIQPSSLARSAAEIMRMNPLGGVCGVVCPDTFCMKACAREALDQPIDIPAVQATIMKNARDAGLNPTWSPLKADGNAKIAIVGAGPSGLACASVLSRHPKVGSVTIFDRRKIIGGATRTIPESRLPTPMLEDDIAHIQAVGETKIDWRLNQAIQDYDALKDEFDAICIATGLSVPRRMGISEESNFAHPAINFLWKAKHNREEAEQIVKGKRVAIIGGGAVAVDAATTAIELGAQSDGVSILYRRGVSEMPVTAKERARLLSFGIDVIPRQVPVRFTPEGKLVTRRSTLPTKTSRLHDPHRPNNPTHATQSQSEGVDYEWKDIDVVIVAIGDDVDPLIAQLKKTNGSSGPFYFAGDAAQGASTVVQASAFGKNTAQKIIDDLFHSAELAKTHGPNHVEPMTKSFLQVPGYNTLPADISVDFFQSRTLLNPFILSASPMSDGFQQVDDAFQMGWGGAILKTTFDDVHFPVHVPNRYMERFDGDGTYGNCDNVSDHPISRVTKEVRELVQKWGSQGYLVAASTGGDMSGNIEHDRHSWQTNTRALEEAGAMAIEYSLSCPQGGEGAEASQIVSQSATLAARVVEYILSGARRPDIPKLFKLTAAVASVVPIISAMQAVFARFPDAKVGITLANSFPVMGFRENTSADHPRKWPHGIVFGMAGAGVLPISYRTLSEATDLFPQLYISANGGIMDSESSANVLALGCQSVQLCTLPTRDGIDCIEHLTSGLAHLLKQRNIPSVRELIGIAHWDKKSSVKGFMELPPKSEKSTLIHPETCISCGNCTRCPYLAIELDSNTHLPIIDPSKCVGCSMCILKCPTQSLALQ